MSKKQAPKATKKAPTQKNRTPEPKAAKATATKAKAQPPAPEKKATPQEPPPEPKGTVPSLATDPRLPAVGTVIQKRDRHGVVRCDCAVEKEGIRYGGTLYRSISSAALAAARDLGMKNKTQNGYVFWGLVKAGRPAGDPIEVLEKAWARYRTCVEALVSADLQKEQGQKLAESIAMQAAAIKKSGERITSIRG